MLDCAQFDGTPRQCGRAYADEFQREIAGFFFQEFGAYKYSEKFVKACLRKLLRQAPHAGAFLEGMAERSLLTRNQLALLMLHEEELYHRRLKKQWPHCTAIGRGASASKQGAIVGQNWDWSTSYYPWSALLRFRLSGLPRVLSLAYPGLPVCAGINSAGLTLMWSGSGYYPPILPKEGVPTYALCFEVLLKRNVRAALRYLEEIDNAGAFMFFLGDESGDFAVVEGVPGKIFVSREKISKRSNVFENSACMRAARQKLPSEKKCHSVLRNRILAEAESKLLRRHGVQGIKKALSLPNILIEKAYSHATLVQLVADCQSRCLHVRPWRQCRQAWKVYRA